MSEETIKYQLIARQGPASNPRLSPLLQALTEQFGLDAYTARVRLTGSGKALIGSGTKEKTTQLAEVLRAHAFDCWVIRRTKAGLSPVRMRELAIRPDRIELVGRDTTISIQKGSTVVAVLGDVSGKIEERTLTHLATQERYKRSLHVTGMGDEKMVESVLKGSPVLDLYVLNEQGTAQGSVRIFPARFNAKGLGERMTMSSTRNMMAIVELAREYSSRVTLHADFGVGRLPDCQIKNLDGQFLAEDQILESLTRFGWLMCDLEQDRPVETSPEDVAPSLAAAAIAAGRPALAAAIASGDLEAASAFKEVVEEIREAAAENEKTEVGLPVEEWLPSPPDRPARQISGRMLLSAVGTFLLAGFIALIGQGDTPLLRTVATYGVKAGAIPGLLAAGLFCAGFYFVKLKRVIENTPTSRIRSMAMGMVEVHGKTVRKYALVSPMNQSACVYYRLRKYRKDNQNRWVLKSDKDSRHVPFYIDDGTGQVTIDPSGATVRARTSRTGMPGEATLAFHGVSTDDPDEKWIEEIIFEGIPIYVLGYARPLREKRKNLRDRTVEKLRDLKLDRKALHRYDADGDGQISEDEWQTARSDAEQRALKDHLAEGSSGKRQEEHAVITRPPQRGLPFVIAEAVEEENLIRNYWLISIPLIISGLIAAGFALYYFLSFAGV